MSYCAYIHLFCMSQILVSYLPLVQVRTNLELQTVFCWKCNRVNSQRADLTICRDMDWTDKQKREKKSLHVILKLIWYFLWYLDVHYWHVSPTPILSLDLPFWLDVYASIQCLCPSSLPFLTIPKAWAPQHIVCLSLQIRPAMYAASNLCRQVTCSIWQVNICVIVKWLDVAHHPA